MNIIYSLLSSFHSRQPQLSSCQRIQKPTQLMNSNEDPKINYKNSSHNNTNNRNAINGLRRIKVAEKQNHIRELLRVNTVTNRQNQVNIIDSINGNANCSNAISRNHNKLPNTNKDPFNFVLDLKNNYQSLGKQKQKYQKIFINTEQALICIKKDNFPYPIQHPSSILKIENKANTLDNQRFSYPTSTNSKGHKNKIKADNLLQIIKKKIQLSKQLQLSYKRQKQSKEEQPAMNKYSQKQESAQQKQKQKASSNKGKYNKRKYSYTLRKYSSTSRCTKGQISLLTHKYNVYIPDHNNHCSKSIEQACLSDVVRDKIKTEPYCYPTPLCHQNEPTNSPVAQHPGENDEQCEKAFSSLQVHTSIKDPKAKKHKQKNNPFLSIQVLSTLSSIRETPNGASLPLVHGGSASGSVPSSPVSTRFKDRKVRNTTNVRLKWDKNNGQSIAQYRIKDRQKDIDRILQQMYNQHDNQLYKYNKQQKQSNIEQKAVSKKIKPAYSSPPHSNSNLMNKAQNQNQTSKNVKNGSKQKQIESYNEQWLTPW